jgi:uncharacterized protein (DUF433 family)
MRQIVLVTSAELLERIVVDAAICFGKPTTRGHRISFSPILGYLAHVRFVDLDDVA